jgi:Ca-activated chloride channel family protein
MVVRRLALVCALALGVLWSLRPVAAQERNGRATFSITVDQVLLNVAVRDAAGKPVPGLKESNFVVLDDGVRQNIAAFAEESSPLSIVLLLDTSSSMQGGQLARTKQAAADFLARLPKSTEVALLTFNDRVQTVAPFSEDRMTLSGAISKLAAGGGTALYDALAAAIQTLRGARFDRHFVVVFSDGMDTDSSHKFSDVQRAVERTNVVVYAVGEYSEPERKLYMTGARYYKDPPLETNYNPVWVLRHIAQISGGLSFFPASTESLDSFFGLIAADLTHQYAIAYHPEGVARRPGYHIIEVRVTASNGPLTVRTRKGYRTEAVQEQSSTER